MIRDGLGIEINQIQNPILNKILQIQNPIKGKAFLTVNSQCFRSILLLHFYNGKMMLNG